MEEKEPSKIENTTISTGLLQTDLYLFDSISSTQRNHIKKKQVGEAKNCAPEGSTGFDSSDCFRFDFCRLVYNPRPPQHGFLKFFFHCCAPLTNERFFPVLNNKFYHRTAHTLSQDSSANSAPCRGTSLLQQLLVGVLSLCGANEEPQCIRFYFKVVSSVG